MKKLLIFFLLLSSTLLLSQKKEGLITYSFEDAFELQKESKKPMAIFFHTNWCRYCFAMQKNTFTNQEVIQLLNKYFYFVSFDAESKTEVSIKNKTFKNTSGVHDLAIRLASKNGYISYPSLIVLNHKKRIDEQVNSFLSAKELEELLRKYIKKKLKLQTLHINTINHHLN